MMNKYILFAATLLLGFSSVAFAAPTITYQTTLLPQINLGNDLGTSTQAWRDLFIRQICFTGDTCKTAWPTGSGTFPFTPTTFGSTAANSTSTLIGLTQGLYALASSTIGDGTRAGGLTISGGATTTGTGYFAGLVGIGTTTPAQDLSVTGDGYFTGGLGLGSVNTTAGSLTATGAIHTDTTLSVGTANNSANGFNLAGTYTGAGFAVSPTITGTGASGMTMSPTINGSATGQQVGFNETVIFQPTGASLSNDYGVLFINKHDNSGAPVTTATGLFARLDTGAGYTGTITNGNAFVAGSPSILGANPVTNYTQFSGGFLINGTGTTTGTVSNVHLLAGGGNSSAATGGTINNYGVKITLDAGSGTGTNNNYGLYITGNGGASATTNYGIYNQSTANNYIAGNVGLGTTTPGYKLAVSGTTNTNVASFGSAMGGATDWNGIVLGYNSFAGGGVEKSGIFFQKDGSGFNRGRLMFAVNNTGDNSTQASVSDAVLTIAAAGNVGIGTTTPYAKLAVAGTVVADNIVATSTATSTFQGGLSTNLLNVTSTTATSTFANGINLTKGCFSVNGTCIGAGGSGTVTGVLGTWPIISDGSATTPTISWGGLSTSTPAVVGNIPYFSGVNTFANVATSSISVSAGLTNTGTLGSQIGGSAVTLKQIENRSFSYATSTAWTATTTIPLGVGYGEAWNSAKCFTDTGTLNVDFYHSTTHYTFFNASTTVGTVSMLGTDTSGDKVSVDIGTPASSPTKITCTINDTI